MDSKKTGFDSFGPKHFKPIDSPPLKAGELSPALSSQEANVSPTEVASPEIQGTSRFSKHFFRNLLSKQRSPSSESKSPPAELVRQVSSDEIMKEQAFTKDAVLERSETGLKGEAGSEIATLVSEIGDTVDALMEKKLVAPSKQQVDVGWWGKAVSSVKLRGLKSLLATFRTPHLFKRLVTTIAYNLVHHATLCNAASEQEKCNCHDLASLGSFLFDRVNGELTKVAEASARTFLATQSGLDVAGDKTALRKQRHSSIDAELKESIANETEAINRAAEALYQLILPNGSRDLHPNQHIANFMSMYVKRKVKQMLTDYADYKKREMGEKFQPGHQLALQRAQGAAKDWFGVATTLLLKKEQVDHYAELAVKALHRSDQEIPESEIHFIQKQFHGIVDAIESSSAVQELMLPWILRFQAKGNPSDNAIEGVFKFLNGEAPHLNSAFAQDRASPPEKGEEGSLSKHFVPFVNGAFASVGLGFEEWPLPFIFEKAMRKVLLVPLSKTCAENYSLWNLSAFKQSTTTTDPELLKAFVANQGVQKTLGPDAIAACAQLAEDTVSLIFQKGEETLGLPKQTLESPYIKMVLSSVVLQLILNAAVNSTEGEGVKTPEAIVHGIAKRVGEIVKNFAAVEGNREKLDGLLREAAHLMDEKKRIQAGGQGGSLKPIEEKLSQLHVELSLALQPLSEEFGKMVSECPQGSLLFGMIPFNKQLRAQWETFLKTGLASLLAGAAMTKMAPHWTAMRETVEARTTALQSDQKAKEACQVAAEHISVGLPSYIEVKGDGLVAAVVDQTIGMLTKQLGDESPFVVSLKTHPEQTRGFFRQALVGMTSDPLFQTIAQDEIAKHIEFFALPALKRVQDLDKEGEATFMSQLANGVAQKTKEHLQVINERHAAELREGVPDMAPLEPQAAEMRQKQSFNRAATTALVLAGIRQPSDLGLPSPLCDKAYNMLHEKLANQFQNTFLKLTDPKTIKEKVYQTISKKSEAGKQTTGAQSEELVDAALVEDLTAEIVEFLPATWAKTFLGQGFAQEKAADVAVRAISKEVWKRRDVYQTMVHAIEKFDIKPAQEERLDVSTEQIKAEMENRVRTETVDWMAKQMSRLWTDETASAPTVSEEERQVVAEVGESVNAGWMASTFAFVSHAMTNAIVSARDTLISTGAGMVSSDAEVIMQNLHFEEHRDLFLTLFDEAINLLEKQIKS